MMRAAAASLLVALLAASPLAVLAQMYKWVDDKGVVHYSDRMPADAVNRASTKLSPQGIPVRKVDPAATPETLKAREAELEKQKDAQRQQQETARRDRALLDSYTTEADIDLARLRAMRTVDDALQSTLGFRSQLEKRRASLVERKTALAGKPVPADLERELASVDGELARQDELIAQKYKQIDEIKLRYEADKERWRQLSGRAPTSTSAARPPASAPAPASSAPAPGAAPSVPSSPK